VLGGPKPSQRYAVPVDPRRPDTGVSLGHGRGAPVDPPSSMGVALLAGIALGLAVLLGVVGYFFVGFGMATTCTDRFLSGDRCETLYHWLNANAIGQLIIAVTAAALIIAVRRTPRRRQRTLCAVAILLILLSPTWMLITSILGGRSFGY
jgi:hypothetical protein